MGGQENKKRDTWRLLTQVDGGGHEMVARVRAHGRQGEADVGGRVVETVAAGREVTAVLWKVVSQLVVSAGLYRRDWEGSKQDLLVVGNQMATVVGEARIEVQPCNQGDVLLEKGLTAAREGAKIHTGPLVAVVGPVIVVAVHAKVAAGQVGGLPGAVADEALRLDEAEEAQEAGKDRGEDVHDEGGDDCILVWRRRRCVSGGLLIWTDGGGGEGKSWLYGFWVLWLQK